MIVEQFKRAAAQSAVAHVESGMTVGLGTGSTARHAVDELGRLLHRGLLHAVKGVPTSAATARQAQGLGIPLIEPGPVGVDIAIDGMDELDANLDAIKGQGGALTREKIVAARARQLILIGDASKQVFRLGQRAAVPVEVVPFGAQAVLSDLAALGCTAGIRMDDGGRPFRTDNGNIIIDCRFTGEFDPAEVAAAIKRICGVVEHGLFLGLAHRAYLAGEDGVAELTR